MKQSPKKMRDPNRRAAHFRALSFRTDRSARRGRATLERDAARIAAGPLGTVTARPLASQPMQPQAER